MGTEDLLKLEADDIELFRQPLWLNDNCIEFWVEHTLEDQVPASRRDDVGFISPSAMHMASFMSEEMAKELFEPLKLPSKELILMPINDNAAPEAVGGSHWALLVYERRSKAFRLYDSIQGRNAGQAQAAMAKLSLAIGAPEAKFEVEKHSPQQDNGYDCGAIVCLVAGLVLRAFLEGKGKPVAEELSTITSSVTAQARSQVMKRAQEDR